MCFLKVSKGSKLFPLQSQYTTSCFFNSFRGRIVGFNTKHIKTSQATNENRWQVALPRSRRLLQVRQRGVFAGAQRFIPNVCRNQRSSRSKFFPSLGRLESFGRRRVDFEIQRFQGKYDYLQTQQLEVLNTDDRMEMIQFQRRTNFLNELKDYISSEFKIVPVNQVDARVVA